MALPFMHIVSQRQKTDCGAACLAMLLSKSYEEVVMACHEGVLDDGLTNRQMIAAAKKLGRRLQWSRKFNLEADTGILMVNILTQGALKKRFDHFVILRAGDIIDTDNTLWDVDVYMATMQGKPLSLLVEKE